MANLDIIATLSQYPYQGIQTLVDKVYLYNPLEINNLIVQLNELIEKLGGMTGVDYNGLNNKPVLNTKNKTSLPVIEDETIVDTIMLHEVSKTGDYNSLLNLPPLGKLSAKDQIKDVDVADDAAIARSKLASDVVASLDLADTAVQKADYNTKMESLDASISTLNSGLQAEIAARADADAVLQGNINSEASTRASEDAKLAADIAKNTTAISDEATARNQADAALQDSITKEATTRSNADKALQNGIDAEATARAEADTALQTSITKNAGDITTLRNDVDGLGDQVHEIEAKVPADASASNQLATKADVSGLETSLAKVAKTGSYNDLGDKPTIGNAVLTITRNNESAGSFSANATENQTINIAVPVSAGDVNALPDTTKYGASVSLTMDSTTYKVSASLKDQNGDVLGTVQTIDLPLESVVVSGTYDATTKEVVLTLQDGSEIRFSVADLVDGLQTEITESNKLSADLVDDSTTVNKFVTSAEKATWNSKQDAISDLATIRAGASKGATAVQPAAIADMETKTYAAATYQPKGDYATSTELTTGLATKADTTTTDTLRNDVDGLGDQVQEIEAKIPGDATASNQLATKADIANIGALPAQAGNAGKFLTTDGTNASWGGGYCAVAKDNTDYTTVVLDAKNYVTNFDNASVVISPTLSGRPQNLSTSIFARMGGAVSVGVGFGAYASALYSVSVGATSSASASKALALGYNANATADEAIQLGDGTNSTSSTLQVFDKQLMDANGYIPSARLAADGTTGQVLSKTDTGMEWKDASGGSVDIDNLTITENASNKIQAVAVVNQNSGVLKSWTGTLAQYTALETKSDDTQYIITDDDSAGTNVYTKAEVDSLVTSAVSQANAHQVIEFQAPTAENGYTWYRKYTDGWVEQGGIVTNSSGEGTVTLPVTMSDTNYSIISTNEQTDNENAWGYTYVAKNTKTTTGFHLKSVAQGNVVYLNAHWEVRGMAE